MLVQKIDDSDHSDDGSKVAGKIQVDGKDYSVEDVQNIIKQGASATQKAQEVAGVIAAAEKYGVDPETYIAQAEGAFGVMSQLIADKVIDEKGNILKVKVQEPKDDELGGDDDFMKLFNLPAGDTKSLAGADKIAAIVTKALGSQFDEIKKLGERVTAVDKTQGDMIRLNLQEKVMAKFPVLKPSDVSQAFGSAMNDRSKSLWEHAEVLANVKAAELTSLRTTHAKEFGIDITKFDENKLKEQEAGGGAGVIFKGKKFSFDAKEGDENAVSPRKAATEYIESIASKS